MVLHCRCVKDEGEIEKLQAKVVEMRRKLDDTTAAMQELGRENQSLQVLHTHSHTPIHVHNSTWGFEVTFYLNPTPADTLYTRCIQYAPTLMNVSFHYPTCFKSVHPPTHTQMKVKTTRSVCLSLGS